MCIYLLIPGIAITIRDTTTCVIALAAALDDVPTRFPFSSKTGMPLVNSLQLYIYTHTLPLQVIVRKLV